VNKIIISLFISGLLFGSGPCIASCGPILISYIVGTRKDLFKSLIAYILFSLTRILVYLILSLAIFFLGNLAMDRLLGNSFKYILIIGGVFIVSIGLLMILGKKLKWQSCHFLEKNILQYDKKSIVMLGLIMGLLPCAPLLAILSYIGLISKLWLTNLLYSFCFGIGTFLSPLILLTLLAGLFPRWLKDKKVVYERVFSFVGGLVIVFLGLQLIGRAFRNA